jgi:hypothetical protein
MCRCCHHAAETRLHTIAVTSGPDSRKFPVRKIRLKRRFGRDYYHQSAHPSAFFNFRVPTDHLTPVRESVQRQPAALRPSLAVSKAIAIFFSTQAKTHNTSISPPCRPLLSISQRPPISHGNLEFTQLIGELMGNEMQHTDFFSIK